MSINVLEKLFGSSARVKIMRFFLFHSEGLFDKSQIIKRTHVTSSNLNKELNLLLDIGLIKKKVVKKKIQGYFINTEFSLITPLKSLLIENDPLQENDLIKKLNKVGKIKLVLTSGIFIQDPESRVDLFVVGDEIKEKQVKGIISKIEAEIGKELKYAIFSTADFKYRSSICDRLVRDVMDLPHRVVVDRLGI